MVPKKSCSYFVGLNSDINGVNFGVLSIGSVTCEALTIFCTVIREGAQIIQRRVNCHTIRTQWCVQLHSIGPFCQDPINTRVLSSGPFALFFSSVI